ncbi:hypothetical protein HOL63_02740 [Candidatus Peregrinibacteria bacterium]|jgi:hypothetical protein|nr:hypothetical protein [Candidatus Peregrinibacteria bacterium]MBT5468178.1 hypothetical protein [Candidatus Peregrinibacteria bacterium]MBT7337931.1 hypothetical protein [Candidatus Peregrinibacteria bacterium]
MSTLETFPDTEPDNAEVQAQAEFIPTPDRLSQYLEMDIGETIARLTSVEGRQVIFKDIEENQEHLREIYPEIDFDKVRHDLDVVGETLQKKEDFLESMDEEQGLLRRAWEHVKKFPKKHPVVTALLAAALVTGTIATGFYMAGEWELFMSSVGLDKVLGGAGAAGELIPPTPSTPALPGGGMFEVVPPSTPPGAVPGLDTLT